MTALLVASAVLIVLGRFTVPSHKLSWPGSYEAIAHIWVGILATIAYYEWGNINAFNTVVLLISTTIFETVMFFMWPTKDGKLNQITKPFE